MPVSSLCDGRGGWVGVEHRRSAAPPLKWWHFNTETCTRQTTSPSDSDSVLAWSLDAMLEKESGGVAADGRYPHTAPARAQSLREAGRLAIPAESNHVSLGRSPHQPGLAVELGGKSMTELLDEAPGASWNLCKASIMAAPALLLLLSGAHTRTHTDTMLDLGVLPHPF